jgi:CheY-like chemotaxis protein
MESSVKQDVILIADDNDILRTALGEMLSLAGFEIFSAPNGREALAKMEDITPDLIVSDITMPDMDGYAFFDAVRARSE